MATRSIILVPPFIKYSAGPLLGPALLQSAARSRGHWCNVIDLNAMYIGPRTSNRVVTGKFVGDHDKPSGPRSLTLVEEQFMESHIISALKQSSSYMASKTYSSNITRAKFGFLTHDQIMDASNILAEQQFGDWVKNVVAEQVNDSPDVVGISLLHSGQMIPSAAISKIVRQLWPRALVVWGGPHISGLGKHTLREDLPRRLFAADVFVTGHAEETFVRILENLSALKRAALSSPVILEGESSVISPTFDNLELYDAPLVFPAQSSIGCAYGRCSYCTYPNIEGRPQKLDLDASVNSVVDHAQIIPGSTVSIKDSLVSANRLVEIGDCIKGRVKWSACTKLSRRLDSKRLAQLTESGLATLEVGLETLLPESQHRINKIQPQSLYEDFLALASSHELSIVVNYMIGFPWEDPEAARSKLNEAETLLMGTMGKERGLIELNEFELERLAPMAKFPEAYGIDHAKIQSWPWASVLEIEKNTRG